MDLIPGTYTVTMDMASPGIAYGNSSCYAARRATNALLDFDVGDVSVSAGCCGPPETPPEELFAIACYGMNADHDAIDIKVLRETTVYAYLIDRDRSDNSGSVRLQVKEGVLKP